MALDMYSESSSSSTSPRLSFSHNLIQPETTTTTSQVENHPIRLDSSLLDPNPDFDFRLTNDTIQPIEISPADELFSRGLIRPLQIQERFPISNQLSISNSQLPPLPNTLPKNAIFNQENTSKAIIISDQNQPNSNKISNSKSFWRIKRSSSLHVDNTYKKSSFWSSLPLLSRSNSTGSVPSPKQGSSQRQLKNSMTGMNSSSSSSSSSSFYMYTLSQKPPLKRNYGGGGVGYGNGVRISPVLNVAPHFISKGTASLFGLGSFFGNGKDKKNKK